MKNYRVIAKCKDGEVAINPKGMNCMPLDMAEKVVEDFKATMPNANLRIVEMVNGFDSQEDYDSYCEQFKKLDVFKECDGFHLSKKGNTIVAEFNVGY